MDKRYSVWVEENKLDDLDKFYIRCNDYKWQTKYDIQTKTKYYSFDTTLKRIKENLNKYNNIYNRYEFRKLGINL